MRADELVGRLQKVRARGRDQWMACCPAHQDKRASLSIKGEAGGRILLHCFGGCDPDDVLGALGLTFADVMPERLTDCAPSKRLVIAPADALRILRREMTLVGIVASDMLAHREVTEETWQRFAQAAARIQDVAGWTE